MNGDLSFNGHILQTNNIVTNVIDHADQPDQNTGFLEVANANRSAITNIDYSSRKISIAGVIKGSSQVDLDNRIDAFKGYFNGKDKNLDINYAGGTRRYIATKNAISISRRGSVNFAPFKVEFICSEPFGLDVTPTVIVDHDANTLGSYTFSATIDGTAPYQLPIFTITVNALTGTGDYIQLTNNANNQSIIILDQNIEAGDILIVNADTHKVTLAGVEIDYTGVFFELEPGNASLTYTDGFSTRNVDIYAEYFKRYQ